eukprot:SAG31_NODE_12538_length_934_cov_0.894611_1_plen_246_part_10
MGVQGWPMLIWSHRGDWLRYEGQMHLSSIVDFATARHEVLPVRLDGSEAGLAAFLADRTSAVFVSSAESSEHQELFDQVALWGRQMSIPPLAATIGLPNAGPDESAYATIPVPTATHGKQNQIVAHYPDGGYAVAPSSVWESTNQLREWIRAESIPSILPFTSEVNNQILFGTLGKDRSQILLFGNGSESYWSAATAGMRAAYPAYKGQSINVAVDKRDPFAAMAANYFGVCGTDEEILESIQGGN